MTSNEDVKKKKDKLYGTLFLAGIAGISTMVGFGTALASTRKQDAKNFEAGLYESGTALATKALIRGSLWAIGGCGLLFFGIWKLSGAKTAEEFRLKAGSILPRIPKNNPPQSRTEFENLTDFLRYVSEEWGKEK